MTMVYHDAARGGARRIFKLDALRHYCAAIGEDAFER